MRAAISENLLTGAEASRRLQVPQSAISRAVAAGTIRPDFVAGHVQLFHAASLPAIAAALASRRTGPGRPPITNQTTA